MRHLPIILSAVLASVGLLVVSGQAHAAMPALSIGSFRCHGRGRQKGRLLLSPPLGLLTATGPTTAPMATIGPMAITAGTADPTIATATSKRRGHRSGPLE
jgi:hypothetical protein